MLCNNPKKYAVVEPEGRILGQKCTDIVVRHVAVSPASVQQTDKFRIHIYDEGSTEIAGKRDILATLHPGGYSPSINTANNVHPTQRMRIVSGWSDILGHVTCIHATELEK